MGVIDDGLTALQDWFKELSANGVESSLSFSNALLGNALNNNSGNGANEIFSDYLTNPSSFTGGGSNAVWTTIKTLSDNIIVPLGVFVFTIVILTELIQMVVDSNNFKQADTSIFIRWLLKSISGVLLISNVFNIATSIFVFGSNAVTRGLEYLFPATSTGVIGDINISDFHTALVSQTVGELLIELLLSAFLVIVNFGTLGTIIVVLANRIIEIFMYLCISPIPMATMMSKQWNDMGKNWFRNVVALSFQGFFIVIALGIFKTLFNSSLVALINGTNCILTMATLLGFSIALIFTIFRTGHISKSIFNAH